MSSLVENATIKIRRDSASNWASNNPTPASGEWCIETDTGQVKIGDGSTAWNAKGYHIKNPESFDISSSNQVYNLPAVKGGQKEIIKWSGGDGTYKLTFTTQGSDTIGGLAASVWEGEGEGVIVLSDDGGVDWVVHQYEDNGSNTNGEWWKFRDGTMRQTVDTGSEITVGNALGSIYYTASPPTLVFPKTFNSVNKTYISNYSGANVGLWAGKMTTTTTALTVYMLSAIQNDTCRPQGEVLGTWR